MLNYQRVWGIRISRVSRLRRVNINQQFELGPHGCLAFHRKGCVSCSFDTYGTSWNYMDTRPGKLTKTYGKSPCYQWVNPLFRLGYFQQQTVDITRGYPLQIKSFAQLLSSQLTYTTEVYSVKSTVFSPEKHSPNLNHQQPIKRHIVIQITCKSQLQYV